ncbi:uncharacterized protein LOC141506287 [Macrotis lagotis]|uniref:uncharacterized protein LOC141506287 n=1 Tax=Macrotis lagotis TaxID=92651 RepID=UPI003D689D3A
MCSTPKFNMSFSVSPTSKPRLSEEENRDKIGRMPSTVKCLFLVWGVGNLPSSLLCRNTHSPGRMRRHGSTGAASSNPGFLTRFEAPPLCGPGIGPAPLRTRDWPRPLQTRARPRPSADPGSAPPSAEPSSAPPLCWGDSAPPPSQSLARPRPSAEDCAGPASADRYSGPAPPQSPGCSGSAPPSADPSAGSSPCRLRPFAVGAGAALPSPHCGLSFLWPRPVRSCLFELRSTWGVIISAGGPHENSEAIHNKEFQDSTSISGLQVTYDLPPGWLLSLQGVQSQEDLKSGPSGRVVMKTCWGSQGFGKSIRWSWLKIY